MATKRIIIPRIYHTSNIEGGRVGPGDLDLKRYITLITEELKLAKTVASAALLDQTAAIAATDIYTTLEGGFYRLSFSAEVNRAATSSSVLGPFQYKFTEANMESVVTAPPGNTNHINQSVANSTATGYISGTYIIHAKAGTAIQYIMGYSSTGATTMRYNIHVILEKLYL